MSPLALAALALGAGAQEDRLALEALDGPGGGRRVVLVAGDEEYRSEEALPQLAKILARHGFSCTVLFPLAEDGTVDPERRDSQPGLEELYSADLCVLMVRFRRWLDAGMRHFDSYVSKGKPFVGIRTSTHAFDGLQGPFARYDWRSRDWPGGFGRQVLGETWVSHWGDHGSQATLGRPEGNHPVLRGVGEIFVPTDVYEAHPPEDAAVLVRGWVVAGMAKGDPVATGTKKDAHGRERGLNDPPMPVAWVREPAPGQRVFTTTMGSAADLLDADFRRLLVNACYWACGLQPPARADVGLVGDYRPSPYGFGGFRKGVRPADLR